MQKAITASGMRPINNIVDITNFVMLETGNPMHAFNYDDLSNKQIIVRNAKEGETITTIDGTECKLTPDMLVIADGEKPSCLAGIMGNKRWGAIIGGTVLALGLRFICHYVSGVLIFNSFGELWSGFSTDNTWLYSLLYNGAYMLPEAVFTTLGAIFLFKTPQMRKVIVRSEG